jgi:hypothetical protein
LIKRELTAGERSGVKDCDISPSTPIFELGDLEMRRRDAGRGLMAAGVICFLGCVPFVLGDLSTGAERIATTLLYVGIVAFVAGIVVFSMARAGNQLRK